MNPQASSKHIAVVDDEAAMRKTIEEYLTLSGFRVTSCNGGASLRELMSTSPVDLIVLDLNMPEEDGLSITRHVKNTSNIPVVLLTATASAIDRVVGLEIGADDYLAKPCELRELLARIRTVLRRSSAQPSLNVPRRQLAAIVSLDLVGFGRLLQSDEAGTLTAIDRVFKTVVGPSLAEHGGNLFKTMGDGALIEFSSVVDSVQWAISFQRGMKTGQAGEPDRSLRFRLGVAIGDVVFAGTDRFGEGVALAVRVQEVGQPGRVTLSDFTHQLVRARIQERFDDRGTHVLKNIAEPMRIWDWGA